MSAYLGVNGARYREDDEGYEREAVALFQARREANAVRGRALIQGALEEAAEHAGEALTKPGDSS